MSRAANERRGLVPGHPLRIVMQCRDRREVTLCEHVTFAFARDAGLRGVDVWYAAACAAVLGDEVLAGGGGEVVLHVVDAPRLALELRASYDGLLPAELSTSLQEVREHMSELRVEWRASSGVSLIARKWLQ